MQTETHWENVCTTKPANEISWFQEHSAVSLALVKRTGVKQQDFIIDVGGVTLTLVNDLLLDGFEKSRS